MGILSYVAGKLQSNSVQVALVDDVIGVGQTWQDMTASRAFGVTYTNNTGKPIQAIVAVSINSANSWCEVGVYIDDVSRGANSASAGAAQYPRATISIIIPSGSTYKFISQGSNIVSVSWSELREAV